MKRSVRKIESITESNLNMYLAQPGYLVTKTLKQIPEQFVYKIEKKGRPRDIFQGYSPSPLMQQTKPRTSREEDQIQTHLNTDYDRDRSPLPEECKRIIGDADATNINIASQIQLQQMRSIGEDFTSFRDHNPQRERAVRDNYESFGQHNENISSVHNSEIVENQQMRVSQIRRSLSPRGLKSINN